MQAGKGFARLHRAGIYSASYCDGFRTALIRLQSILTGSHHAAGDADGTLEYNAAAAAGAWAGATISGEAKRGFEFVFDVGQKGSRSSVCRAWGGESQGASGPSREGSRSFSRTA